MAQSTSRSSGGSRATSNRPASDRPASSKRSASRSSNGSGSKARASNARQASARKASSNSRSTARKAPATSGGGAKQAATSGAQSAMDTVADGAKTAGGAAKTAGGAIGTAAQKAKGPALAGGAALAGLAGGLAIAARSGPRRILGVPVPGTRRPLVKVTAPRRARVNVRGKDLLKAAGEVGAVGRQVGDLASEMRQVREQMHSRRRRSPVEVVLEGLTARRPRR
jgi:hypothetical protein